MSSPRLWEILTRPGAVVRFFDGDVIEDRMVPDHLRRTWLAAIHILADEPADWFFADVSTDDDAWSRGYGPLRPPFDAMCLEWAVPPERYTGSGDSPDLSRHLPSREGVYLERCEPGSLRYRYVAFLLTKNGQLACDWSGGEFEVSERGEMVDATDFGELTPLAIAIGLMNCRNVSVVDEKVSRPASKKQRRARVPRLTYKVISLPKPSTASRADRDAAVESDRAWHIVRGHFKTYTPDAPLLGRLTGTWWWDNTVRGKKSNGIVRKGYSVGVGEA